MAECKILSFQRRDRDALERQMDEDLAATVCEALNGLLEIQLEKDRELARAMAEKPRRSNKQ